MTAQTPAGTGRPPSPAPAGFQPWHEGPFLAFDTETTGTDPETDRIVAATCVRIDRGAEPRVTSWLIDPGVPIPEAATAVHGITDGQALAHGRPPDECLSEIMHTLLPAWGDGVPVLAFNACFDLTILDRELRRHGLGDLDPCGWVLDPYVIDKHVSWRRGKRTLAAQCEHYGVRHDGAHDATADALAAARVLWRIATRYPTVAGKTVAELHEAQIGWAAEQAASFADWLRAQGRSDDLPDGQWPIRAHTPTERSAA